MRVFRRAAVATTTLVLCFGALPSSAQATDPTVSIDRTGTAAGEQLLVTGGGWPNGASLVVELCGHGGLSGSVDCDVAHQATAGVGPNGTFSVELTVALPPSPCPCVIKATDQSSQIAATAPIAVAGLPTVPITSTDGQAVGGIEVSSMKITGGGRWAELFGFGGRRLLEVTLVNTGSVTVQSPDVSVAWGTGPHPDGFVPPPETTPMEPGDTQTLVVPLRRSALTIGEQTAIVELQGAGGPTEATATTTAYPWGLAALGLIGLQVLLLRIRNGVRRHLAGRRSPVDDVPEPDHAILALAAGAPTLTAVPDVEATTIIDLDHMEHQMSRGAASGGAAPADQALSVPSVSAPAVNGNGQQLHRTPLERVPVPTGEDRARNELLDVQIEARLVLKRAIQLSEALVAAAGRRIQVLEDEAAEHRRQAHESYRAALDVLSEARARADEVTAAASAAAARALHDAGHERASAHEALAEIEEQHRRLEHDAATAVARLVTDLQARIKVLPPVRPDDGPEPGLFAQGDGDRRVDDLDHRLASAVSRALTSTVSPRSPDS